VAPVGDHERVRAVSLAVLSSALVVTAGCANPLAALTAERVITVDRQRYLLRSRDDAGKDVDRTAAALEVATPRLAVWDGLRSPVTVHILPDHEALERAVRRPGFDWLRAWARYDDVMLQAPSTWAPSQKALEELLTHELTHCLMFQHSADATSWNGRRIPLWFREGMAIWTARQGDRYPTLEDTSAWRAQHPELDPFRDGDALSQYFSGPVYGLAHHAFSFLVKRYGVEAVKAIMAEMQVGQRFPDAFRTAVGLDAKRFQQDFETYLRLKGFRDWARPVGRAPKRLHDVLKERAVP
jgi:hypothetical protein